MVASVAFVWPGAAQGAFPGHNGKIAFEGTNGDIQAVNPDGSGLSQLTLGGQPAFSADGTRLAYIRYSSVAGLVVANADGSAPSLVRPHIVIADEYSSQSDTFFNASWSPDGSSIAYEAKHVGCAIHVGCLEGPNGVRAIRPDGSGDRELLAPGASNPAYSPDGRRLVWEDHWMLAARPRLHVGNADGTGDTVVTGAAGGIEASWSPDGSRIAFAVPAAGGNDIWAMNPDGTGAGVIIGVPGSDRSPAWSPDGDEIAWIHDGQLWVARIDGSAMRRITPEGMRAWAPDWQPLPGPRREDYKNASYFCKAEREFLGDAAFRQKYGSHGGCVSGQRK